MYIRISCEALERGFDCKKMVFQDTCPWTKAGDCFLWLILKWTFIAFRPDSCIRVLDQWRGRRLIIGLVAPLGFVLGPFSIDHDAIESVLLGETCIASSSLVGVPGCSGPMEPCFGFFLREVVYARGKSISMRGHPLLIPVHLDGVWTHS